MNVFMDKVNGKADILDNEAMRQGRDLEEYVARRFMEATGMKVRRANYMFRSRKYPFMIADVDRLIAGEDAGLECKTVNAFGAGEWADGKVPLHYLMQCYHYMTVTGKRIWYIAAVILGQGFVYRKIVWDDAIIERLIQIEKDFWEDHVVKGIMPSPDGSKAYDEVLNQYFHNSRKASRIPLVGFDEKLDRRMELMEQIEELKKEQSAIEQEVKLFMEENELAVSEKYKVLWSSVETQRLDTKRIRQEMPEVYDTYATTSSTRRFQIKAA